MNQQREDVTTTGPALSLFSGRAQAFTLAVLAGTTMSLAQTGSIPGVSLDDPGNAKPANNKMPNPFDKDETQVGSDLIDSGNVKVTDDLLVDLHVQDEDLGKILQLLSIQSQRNIIASQNVSATVTANLYSVTFYEALDAILGVNGYGYIERGNFIEVYTLEELVKIYEENRPIERRIIHLNYISPADAAEFVQPLLSEKGTIKAPGKLEQFSLPDSAPTGGQDYALDSMLVVFDLQENIDKVEEMIAQIDTKPQMVLIESTILQTAVNEDNSWGVDFALLGSLDFGDFIQLNPVDGLRAGLGRGFNDDGSGSSTLGDKPIYRDGSQMGGTTGVIDQSAASTIKLGLVSGDFGMFISALDAVSDTSIISRPNILTLNRQRARVLVGRKVGYLSTTTTNTSTTQAVEFLDTGTQLHVRPIVGNDGMIRMELLPRVSEAVIRNTNDATGAAVTIPDEITNELTTNVIVRDGQIVVLGGLFRESTINGRNQVPFLGDIPFIGPAFQGHTNEISRNELIFLIKPTIVNDNMLLKQATEAEQNVIDVRTGSREGLLPWSREKQSSQLLVRAQDKMKEGDFDESLYLIQRSLKLNPYQPEAIRMRDHLMNTTTRWPSRSFLEDVVMGSTRNMLSNLDNESLHQWQNGGEAMVAPTTTVVEQPTNDGSFQSGAPSVQTPEFATGQEPDSFGADGQPPLGDASEPQPTTFDEIFSQNTSGTPHVANDTEFENVDATELASSNPDVMSGSLQSAIESDNDSKLTLSVNDQDIRDVIELISLASGENIVVGKSVSGTISADFEDVTVAQALEIIAQQSGFIYAQLGETYAITAPKFVAAESTAVASNSSNETAPSAGLNNEMPDTTLTPAEPGFGNESLNVAWASEMNESSSSSNPSTPAPSGDQFDALANAMLAGSGAFAGSSTGGTTASDLSMTPATSGETFAESSMPIASGELENGTFGLSGLAELEASELAGVPVDEIEFKPTKRLNLPESRQVTGRSVSIAIGNPDFATDMLTGPKSQQTIDVLFDLYVSQQVWGSSMPATTLNSSLFAPVSSSAGSQF